MKQSGDKAAQPRDTGDKGCNDEEDIESKESKADVEEDLSMSRPAKVSVGEED